MEKLQTYVASNKENMDLYTSILPRVHGPNHPDVIEVEPLYNNLTAAVAAGDQAKVDSLFGEIRAVTHDYRIPEDACDTYKATYKFLKQADEMNQADSE